MRSSLARLARRVPASRGRKAAGVRAAATWAARTFSSPATTAPPPLRSSGLAGRLSPGGGAATRGLRVSAPTARGLKTGIVGLPNVGKVGGDGGWGVWWGWRPAMRVGRAVPTAAARGPTPTSSHPFLPHQSTLFNAITENGKAQAANFPFCTIEPNVGAVAVPDARLAELARISESKAIIPTSVEFVDIAGLVKGASKGEGMGNAFLANIRECDAVVQVVRCFDDDDVIHVAGAVDPVEDAGVINFELALADLVQVEKRVDRLGKGARALSKEEAAARDVERGALARIAAALEAGLPARGVPLDVDEAAAVKGLQLLTMKPVIYAANVGEADLADGGASNKHVVAARAFAEAAGASLVVVSAQVEAELKDLDPAEAAEYLTSLGASEGGLSSLVRATYAQLGLQTYFTCGPQETRAWTVRAGATAPQAAGVIHTDFEKGFIRAETVAYDDFVRCGGSAAAKEKGLLRLEGKEYVVAEGDILNFRFAN